MNKRQETLFNFGVKKSRIEGVCDATNNDSSTSSLQNDIQYVQKEGKTTSTQKKKSAFTRKYLESYLKFRFIQCHDMTNCQELNMSFVLLFWEMKL